MLLVNSGFWGCERLRRSQPQKPVTTFLCTIEYLNLAQGLCLWYNAIRFNTGDGLARRRSSSGRATAL